VNRNAENALILATLVKRLVAYLSTNRVDRELAAGREREREPRVWELTAELAHIEGRLVAVMPLAESMTEAGFSFSVADEPDEDLRLFCECGDDHRISPAVSRVDCACGAVWERNVLGELIKTHPRDVEAGL